MLKIFINDIKKYKWYYKWYKKITYLENLSYYV